MSECEGRGACDRPVKGGCYEEENKQVSEFAGWVDECYTSEGLVASLMKANEEADKDSRRVEVDWRNGLKREAWWVVVGAQARRQGAAGHYTHSA